MILCGCIDKMAIVKKILYFLSKEGYGYKGLEYIYHFFVPEFDLNIIQLVLFTLRGNRIVIKKGHFIKINCKGAKLSNNRMVFYYGNGCKVDIGSGASIDGARFELSGEESLISIGEHGRFAQGMVLESHDIHSEVIIGHNTDIWGNGRIVSADGKIVSIGNRCQIAYGFEIRSSDSHSILNQNGERINPGSDVIIGDHVWLGANVKVLKGAVVEDESVIGNDSMLLKGIYRSNCVYVGKPAVKIKDNINWIEERL